MQDSPDGAPDAEGETLEALLAAARAGDVGAFEAFYQATVGPVLAAVRRICGDSHCEDVVADAYFQCWKSLDSFDPARGQAIAWVRTVARSRALDCLRHERRLHNGMNGAPAFDADIQPSTEAGPAEVVEQRQDQERLRAALAVLSARQRQLIGLFYEQECTHGEISVVTGLSLAVVKKVLRQSQARLHATLGRGGPA